MAKAKKKASKKKSGAKKKTTTKKNTNARKSGSTSKKGGNTVAKSKKGTKKSGAKKGGSKKKSTTRRAKGPSVKVQMKKVVPMIMVGGITLIGIRYAGEKYLKSINKYLPAGVALAASGFLIFGTKKMKKKNLPYVQAAAIGLGLYGILAGVNVATDGQYAEFIGIDSGSTTMAGIKGGNNRPLQFPSTVTQRNRLLSNNSSVARVA